MEALVGLFVAELVLRAVFLGDAALDLDALVVQALVVRSLLQGPSGKIYALYFFTTDMAMRIKMAWALNCCDA